MTGMITREWVSEWVSLRVWETVKLRHKWDDKIKNKGLQRLMYHKSGSIWLTHKFNLSHSTFPVSVLLDKIHRCIHESVKKSHDIFLSESLND